MSCHDAWQPATWLVSWQSGALGKFEVEELSLFFMLVASAD